MKAMFLRLGVGLAACSLLLIAGCGDDSDAPTGPAAAEFDFAPILNNFTDNVVIATYADLDERAGELLAAIEALSSDPTAGNLRAARDAWVATRIPGKPARDFSLGRWTSTATIRRSTVGRSTARTWTGYWPATTT